MRVVIAGGSGQAGTVLARHFHGKGDQVTVLSRSPERAPWLTERWDGTTVGDWIWTLDGSDVLINLAGRTVNCRCSEQNRREILQSRVRSTEVLHEALQKLHRRPPLWLNASTATIYRHALDRPMDESTGEFGGNEPGAPDTWNFSIHVAKAWEEAFFSPDLHGTRRVALRSAMIFSPDRDGVFDVFLNLVRHGLGGTNLPGTQYVSWIHDVDFTRAVDFLIDTPALSGPINLSSPDPQPNREFLSILRQAWGIRVGLPTTRWMLEIGTFLMRTESELVLKSRYVVPTRLMQAGFAFRFPAWRVAAEDLVARWRAANQAQA